MKKFLRVLSFILGLINTLAFFALRNCWSGMSGTLGYKQGKAEILLWIPVGLCVLFLLVFLSEIILLKFSKGQKFQIVYTIVELVFSAVIAIVIIFGGQKYVRFALPYFMEYLAISLGVFFVYWLLCVYPSKNISKSGLFKGFVVVLMILVTIGVFTKFRINRLIYEPVVYAVDDEYQIVFSSSAKSLGSVFINGKEYYDLYNGSEKSSELVHKVCVPMEVLDGAGEYTVNLTQVIYRGPFGGILGKDIQKTYKFRPINTSDGFKYLSFSDIHANRKGAVKTASTVSDVDLLVIGGDSLSMVEWFWDANFVNRVCFEITKGEYPVIYARGNHEVKGAYAEELYKYVGSQNGNFYYPVHLKDVYALVLDIGEDHDDDWWEYYTTAHFDEFRKDQLAFINEEKEAGYYESSKYNMVIAHVPIVFVNSRHNHEYIKSALTEVLNTMNVDMNLCAHQHELLIFDPGKVAPGEPLTYNPLYKNGTYKGYLTDFNFPSLMISKPGFLQSESDENEDSHIGLVIEADLEGKTQNCYYINANGEKVSVVNPFADINYGTELQFPIH